MTEIEYFRDRMDFLLKKEQETRTFMHQELQRVSLNLLDKKFQSYIIIHHSNNSLNALKFGEFSIGLGLGFVNKSLGDIISQNAIQLVDSDHEKKEITESIWDSARTRIKNYELDELYKFIPILYTKDLKTIVRHLCIVEFTIV